MNIATTNSATIKTPSNAFASSISLSSSPQMQEVDIVPNSRCTSPDGSDKEDEHEIIENFKENFPGNVNILCNGKIIRSGGNGVLWVTALICIFTITFFIVCLCEDTWSVIPIKHQTIFLIFSIAWIIAFFYMVLMCTLTTFTDPGIIPRDINPRATYRQYGATEYFNTKTISRLVFHEKNPNFLFGKEIIIDGKKTFLKYCGTCQTFRPPRASHCSYCDNCIEQFDHHCPWIANCIGKRNYRYFVLLITSTSFVGIGIIITLMLNLYYTSKSKYLNSLMLVLFTLPTFLVTNLTIYHFYLILIGSTTNENIKNSKKLTWYGYLSNISFVNIFRNIHSTLCGPRYPTMIDWERYTSNSRYM